MISSVWFEQHQRKTVFCSFGDIKQNKAAFFYFLFYFDFHTAFLFFMLCSVLRSLMPFVSWHLAYDQTDSFPGPQSKTRVILTENKTLSVVRCVGSLSCFHSCVLTDCQSGRDSQAIMLYCMDFTLFVMNPMWCQRSGVYLIQKRRDTNIVCHKKKRPF